MDWRTQIRYARPRKSIGYRSLKTSARHRRKEGARASLVKVQKKETAFPSQRSRRLQTRNRQIDSAKWTAA